MAESMGLPESMTLEQTIELIVEHDADPKEYFDGPGYGLNDFETDAVLGWLGY